MLPTLELPSLATKSSHPGMKMLSSTLLPPSVPLPSPSMLLNSHSNSTPEVSTLKRTVETVITTWITLFWPLDTVPNPKETTSSSRTPGVQAGVLMDTLRWPATWTTSAELPPSVSTQPSKLSMKIQNFHLVLGLFFLVPE